MTGEEYLFDLIRALPEDMPSSLYTNNRATIVVTQPNWEWLAANLHGEFTLDFAQDCKRRKLLGYQIGVVDAPIWSEALVPNEEAIPRLGIGDYLVRDDRLWRCASMEGDGNGGVRKNFELVSEILYM